MRIAIIPADKLAKIPSSELRDLIEDSDVLLTTRLRIYQDFIAYKGNKDEIADVEKLLPITLGRYENNDQKPLHIDVDDMQL